MFRSIYWALLVLSFPILQSCQSSASEGTKFAEARPAQQHSLEKLTSKPLQEKLAAVIDGLKATGYSEKSVAAFIVEDGKETPAVFATALSKDLGDYVSVIIVLYMGMEGNTAKTTIVTHDVSKEDVAGKHLEGMAYFTHFLHLGGKLGYFQDGVYNGDEGIAYCNTVVKIYDALRKEWEQKNIIKI